LSYKQINKLLSVKTKTIFLVLVIYFILSIIFFFIRYSDFKEFVSIRQDAELQQVKLIYEVTLQRVKKFYVTRGYANLRSFGIRDAFEKRDITSLYEYSKPRWNIIRRENPYLRSFCFYDNEGNLLTYFGEIPDRKLSYIKTSQGSFDGFCFDSDTFNYHTVTEVKDAKSHTTGYIVFVIDPTYFLSEIEKFMNVYVYISYQKSDHKNMLFISKNDKNIEKIIANHKIKNDSEITTKSSVFVPHIINGVGLSAQDNFQIIFLQDISHWKEILQKAILQSLIALILIMFITAIIINYGFEIILKKLDESNNRLRESQNELENHNKNLQIKIEEEIRQRLKNEREANEKERILVHQSKLASMGEMIGNIAHQWRQPLTELSSIIINLELFFERGKLTKDKFRVKAQEANNQIVFMSKTIDDFRNFFTSNKTKTEYNISYVVENVQKLMDSSLKNNNISFRVDIENDFLVYGYPNEVSQALLNIVSNAKDIILERAIKNGFISIKAFQKDMKHIVTIEDNAGGIQVIPIDKIFEPYFSTKHAKSGTGIGLYMTKTIIEKNNNGTIEVQNSENGAIFILNFS